MAKQKFTLLAGSLALENKQFHLPIANAIKKSFSEYDGYVGYKLTTLGRSSETDVPSFLIFTQQHGIILIDVVEDKIESTVDHGGNEYWITDSKNQIPARSLMLEMYEEEVKSISLYTSFPMR